MTEIIPPWQQTAQVATPVVDASAPAAVKGRKGFQPGRSGNPAGKKPGTLNHKTRIRQRFEEQGEAVADILLEKALEGDLNACAIIMARLEPPLRPSSAPVTFQFDPSLTLTEQAGALMVAISRGQISPEVGKGLMSALSAFAGMKEIDELATQLAELKAHLERQS
jgi:hypothetical protein